MALSGIISVSGLPGLHKVISHTKNGLIVESLIDEKRRPIYSSQKVSALEDISIYTHDDDVPLKDVFKKIFDKEGGKSALDHKENPVKLRKYLSEIVDKLDNERVYNSDVAKLFHWYNLLIEKRMLVFEEEKKPTKKGARKATADKPKGTTALKTDSGKKKKVATGKPLKKTAAAKPVSAAKSATPGRRAARKS